MLLKELHKYLNYGYFIFDFSKPYKQVCNAPNDKSGVYLIYKVNSKNETLLYIGSSGRRDKDGRLQTRIGGLHARLTKGYHPNRFNNIKRIQRHIALPNQMQIEKIEKIKIYWFVTYDENFNDFLTDIENKLILIYRNTNNRLPDWHQSNKL